MGVNNKARRAAKARQRATQRRSRDTAGVGAGGGGGFGGGHGPWCPPGCGGDPGPEPEPLVDGLRITYVLTEALDAAREDPHAVGPAAERLLAGPPERRRLVAAAMDQAIAAVLPARFTGGWTPTDLVEIVTRRAGRACLPLLTGLLRAHLAGVDPARVAPAWRAELDGAGPAAAPDPTSPEGLARLLVLVGLLDVLPPISEVLAAPGRWRPPAATATAPTGGPGRAPTDRDAKQLARVRALLAKAESTSYDAEAEALSAKAQELISRYALQCLLDRAETGGAPDPVRARRIWIDAPYVLAKATLVDVVAGANRCRTVISEPLGFTTVLGMARDLDAVELLSTSLLVQANAAMLRHGRQLDRSGTSRTRSFRSSFLLSYATRIGERLTAADRSAAADVADRDRLLPVLRAATEAVQQEVDRRFPRLIEKSPHVTDARGWAAGRAAADLARLDITSQIPAAGA